MMGRCGVFVVKLLLVWAYLLPCAVGYAQLKSNITHYSTKDGLSHDGVLCITRDRDGFMWFGTFDGIDRFDGHNFVVYKSRPGDSSNLRSNKTRNIIEDKAGYLWIQTFDYKVYRFDKRTERFMITPVGAYKSPFKEQVVIDQVIPDSVSGVWLITKTQGMYYAYSTNKNTTAVRQYTPTSTKPFAISGNKIKFQYTDPQARIWIGTEGGLNCLQRKGNDYQSVTFNAAAQKQLSSYSFTCAARNANELYFGTESGSMLIYNLSTGKFSLKAICDGNKLNSICISKTGLVYISTSGKGLIKFNPANQTISETQPGSTSTYLTLYEDKSGNIWLEPAEDGVVKYDPKTGQFKHYIQKKDFTSASRSYRILTDANGTLWVSMRGGGFGYYDAASDDIKYYFNEPGSADQKFSNVVTSLYVDPTGILWISGKDGGVNKVVPLTDQFNYHHLASKPQNRSENDVRAMMKDAEGRLWICTKDGLVHVYNNDTEINVFGAHSNQLGFVYSIFEDSKGNVWLGTKGNGLFKATPADAAKKLYAIENYRHDDNDINSLSNNQVYSIIEDHKGRVWVGTLGGGLNLFTTFNGKAGFKNNSNDFKTFPFSWAKGIRHLCEDDKGRIWIATSYGLLAFNPDEKVNNNYRFWSYQKIPGDAHSLGNNSVQYIRKDKTGQLWVGTFGGGLNQVVLNNGDVSNARFNAFTTANGLPNDVVLGITVDKQNNLWIATAGGLTKFDPRRKVFKNYDPFDGLSNASFSEASGFAAPNGEMYFTCVDGYLSFNPSTITHKKVSAKLALTNMQLYYKDILPGAANSPLKFAINETESLTLNHDQNVISIDYAVLDYNGENKVTYAYNLDGFDKTWHFVNDLRKATYTNIPPGTYTFRVRGISDDLFNNTPEKTIEIIIKPPFYLTHWAYLAYFVLAVLAFMLARNIIVTMIKLRNKVIIEQKLTEVKLSFFTNISHELRTPLTLIASPLEELSLTENLSTKGQEYFKIINRNVNRMIRFTNQLLDFRKIQSGKMQVNVTEVDLVALSKEVGSCFATIAAEKNITFKVDTQFNTVYAWVDEEKIEIILYNLLSNAFKFSPTGKHVTLEIRNTSQSIELRIIDEGKGVPADHLEEIFEIYHEENALKENHLKGTGIGLALARGLAVSHKGKLWSELNDNGGMTFILELKPGHEHFTDVERSTASGAHTIKHIEAEEWLDGSALQLKNNPDADEPLILIVEDNPDLRAFLEIRLNGLYRVMIAADGAEGLKAAQTSSPDLIISDVVMPNMDGIEMLDQLRHNRETSHIPVILLTAKTSVESRIKGLQYGADFYLTKPFHNDVLLASIQNLLTSRKRLFEQLAGLREATPVIAEFDGPVTTSRDEEFLKEVIKLVEDRINDPGFNIDEVAAGMGMGRTTFYKKLKNLSSLSPVEFVRELRLKRSISLLDTGIYTVSEAGYMAGFNSLAYFSTCFKEKFQVSPSAYLKNIKTAGKHQNL